MTVTSTDLVLGSPDSRSGTCVAAVGVRSDESVCVAVAAVVEPWNEAETTGTSESTEVK